MPRFRALTWAAEGRPYPRPRPRPFTERRPTHRQPGEVRDVSRPRAGWIEGVAHAADSSAPAASPRPSRSCRPLPPYEMCFRSLTSGDVGLGRLGATVACSPTSLTSPRPPAGMIITRVGPKFVEDNGSSSGRTIHFGGSTAVRSRNHHAAVSRVLRDLVLVQGSVCAVSISAWVANQAEHRRHVDHPMRAPLRRS
jgi:hypothetical protein